MSADLVASWQSLKPRLWEVIRKDPTVLNDLEGMVTQKEKANKKGAETGDNISIPEGLSELARSMGESHKE